ncbi:hypothetical protein E3P86_01243 [Wallemia ichthyophaga]|uniref:Oxidoreductase YusZ n=1 Tax=Wallemia ichthyophaga TaxID=245174 RepID=A0A4T0J8G9_WALIC|nr:hypothetical protein E3P86_01243 [Wallemia ichthyophaga]
MSTKVFYITGTSSGFGRDLVLDLNQRGHKVIATARSLHKIEDLAKLDNVKIQQLDVTDKPAILQQKVDEAITFFGKIDALVNNAGYSQTGCFEELTDAEIRKVYDTNVFGTVNLTKAILPHFRSTETESTICTITSLGGTVSFPVCSAYTSSKFALEGFFEALDGELKMSQQPVKVLIVAPGAFRTEFMGNIQKSKEGIDAYKPVKDYIDTSFKQFSVTGGVPKIGAKLMADAMLKEGSAEGKEIPLRLPIGSDAAKYMLDKFKRESEVCEAWKPYAAEADAQ